MSVVDNIALPPSLLSRFDIIYLLLDIPEEATDRAFSRHIISLISLPPLGVGPAGTAGAAGVHDAGSVGVSTAGARPSGRSGEAVIRQREGPERGQFVYMCVCVCVVCVEL